MIRTTEGKEESHLIRPVARSKVASIPVGAEVIFLIDELDKIVDVTMGSVESVHRAAEIGQQKSPLKGNLSQVVGVILKPLKDNIIVIRTEDGKEHSYQVRPLISLSRGWRRYPKAMPPCSWWTKNTKWRTSHLCRKNKQAQT